MNKVASGSFRLLVFLVFLNVFPALSTDIYLPAMPGIAKQFDAPLGLMNLTLVLFFIFYSISMLVWGPLSDKYGRKPILIVGTTIYVIASLFCAMTTGVYQLIFARVFQAIGTGTAVAISTAITKDVYRAREREKILAVIGTMMVVGPVAAPIMGAWILQLTSWRGQFFMLAVFGSIALIGALGMNETVPSRITTGLFGTFGRIKVVLRNRSFAHALILFSFLAAPILTFVSLSSTIFIDGFGMDERTFSYYFASNALIASVGPSVFLLLTKYIKRFRIITMSFMMIVISGFLVFIFGNTGPLVFVGLTVIASLGGTIMRVPSMNLILEQVTHDTGTASSMIGSSAMLIGSLAIFIGSLGWENLIAAAGIINIVMGVFCSLYWWIIRKKHILVDTLNDAESDDGVSETVTVGGRVT